MTDRIELRRAVVEDVDALVDIQFRSPSKEAVAMAGTAEAARRFQALLLARGLTDGTADVIVLEVDGIPAGFAQLSTGGDMPPLRVVARCAVKAMGLRGALTAGRRSLARSAVDLTAAEEGIHLVELQVDPERRNQGLGGRLLAEVERVARERGAPTLSLTTQIDNPARRLYERSGFHVEAEKRDRRYEAITGSPGRVLMTKTVSSPPGGVQLPEPDDLVEEQIDYYRARAPEYDDWWLRTGRYEPDDDFGRRWEAGKRDLEDALRAFAPTGEVLELAAGTGNLTRALAAIDTVAHITALDSSEEALAIARTKVPDARASFVPADLFTWRPERRYDVVAFGFWLSHVPPQRFADFWDLVRQALRPDGRVFFVDNAVPIEQAASAGGRQTSTPGSQTWLDQGVSVRTLADGREFRIVKRTWAPADLERELDALGWSAVVREHQELFVHGEATLKSLD